MRKFFNFFPVPVDQKLEFISENISMQKKKLSIKFKENQRGDNHLEGLKVIIIKKKTCCLKFFFWSGKLPIKHSILGSAGTSFRPGYPAYLSRSYHGYSIKNRWQTFYSSDCAVNTKDNFSFFSFIICLICLKDNLLFLLQQNDDLVS